MTDQPPLPPRDWRDVWAYDREDILAGFREFHLGDPEPGPNRPPGYRWGWANRRNDAGLPDEFGPIRRDYIRATRHTWPVTFPLVSQ